MTVLFRKFCFLRSMSLLKRNFHITPFCMKSAYEGDGKTTVTILNRNFDYGLMIDKLSEHGFVMNNGIRTVGPMIIFSKTMLSWNISTSADMNEESFRLFLDIDPKLDILVIGLDDEYPFNAPFLQNIRDLFRKHKILTEILPVYNACSTFNFLNSENRYVAAALIPPKVKRREDLLLQPGSGKNEDYEDIEKIDNAEDVLLTPIRYKKDQTDTLESQKLDTEIFRVRSPWRPEDKPVNNVDKEDKNKKS